MSQAKKAVNVCVQTNTPGVAAGDPGVGKTAYMNSLARTLYGHCDLPIWIVVPSTMDPTDMGWPTLQKGKLKRVPPEQAVQLAQQEEGMLFVDELTTAPPTMQAALLGLVLDGRVGDLILPKNIRRICAMNPPEQTPGGSDLSPPLANRLVHVDWQVNVSEWCEGALNGFPDENVARLDQDEFEKRLPISWAEVSAFIKHSGEKLISFPKSYDEAGGPWPSPRSWELAVRVMTGANLMYNNPSLNQFLVAGAVGEGAAVEFLNWRREQDLPDPYELLKDPDSYVHPNRSDKLYTILTSVCTAAVQNGDEDSWSAGWEIVVKASEKGGEDVAVISARKLAINKPDGAKYPKQAMKLKKTFDDMGVLKG